MDSDSQSGAVDFEPIADGDLVAVVTFLEMHSPPASLDVPPSPFALRQRRGIGTDEYRRLFRIAGERWLWFSRLAMSDRQLAAIIDDQGVEVFAIVDRSGCESGILELDFRRAGECEIAFLGLAPEFAGQGHGRWLLAKTVQRAWKQGVKRVHVHTCSLDHPAALASYVRAGFVPFRRAIERFRDPRLLGVLPRSAAPQIPLLGTEASRASSLPTN